MRDRQTCAAPIASAPSPSQGGGNGAACSSQVISRCCDLRIVLRAGLVASLGPCRAADSTTRPLVLDRDGRLLRPYRHAGRPLAAAGDASPMSTRASSTCCSPTRTSASAQHHGVDPLALRARGDPARRPTAASSPAARPSPCRWRGCSSRAPSARFSAKLRQIVRAIELERALSKDEILALYLSARALWRQSRRRARRRRSPISARSRAGCRSAKRRCWSRCRNRPKRAGPTAPRGRAQRARPRARSRRRGRPRAGRRGRARQGRAGAGRRACRCRCWRRMPPTQAIAAAPERKRASPHHRRDAAAQPRRPGARARPRARARRSRSRSSRSIMRPARSWPASPRPIISTSAAPARST